MSDQGQKILELEKEIEIKDQELDRAHKELMRVNGVVEKMIQDFSRELKWVHLIQKALSPTEIPNIAGVEFSTKFQPGTKSGGDYFDIFEHEDRMKFGIIVASSSGYTMSSLFLTVLIKMSAQIEARRGLQTNEVLALITKELSAAVENEDYSSLFYGVLDRRNFEFTYTCAGRINGFWQAHGSDKVQKLEPHAPAISRHSKDVKLPVSTLQLDAKDRIILCTEGVGEADLIRKVLAHNTRGGVHEIRNEILFQSEHLTQQPEPARDQTVIVTEVKDRVIKLAQRRP